jgi:hypothetical protein
LLQSGIQDSSVSLQSTKQLKELKTEPVGQTVTTKDMLHPLYTNIKKMPLILLHWQLALVFKHMN